MLEVLFKSDPSSTEANEKLFEAVWPYLVEAWYAGAIHDLRKRVGDVSRAVSGAIVDQAHTVTLELSIKEVSVLQEEVGQLLLKSYETHCQAFFRQPTTADHLGQGTRAIYQYVRETLGVPMHRGLIEHPEVQDEDSNQIDGRPKRTIGSWVSVIYEAIREGALYDEVFGFLQARQAGGGAK